MSSQQILKNKNILEISITHLTTNEIAPTFLGVEAIENRSKDVEFYSHSIVEGGLDEMSYATRFTPFTLFIMSLDTLARKS